MPRRPPASGVDLRVRRARAAVSAVFFVNAVLYANLVPRLPQLKDALDLSNAELGTAIAAMPVGALLSGLLAPLVIQRVGSARTASFGLVLLAAAIAGIPFTGTWLALASVLLLAGALDALVDVGQNAHGFRVQRAYRRSIVNAFHGLWSVGAVAGGLLGSLAAGLGIPLPIHLTVTAVVFSGVAILAYRFMLTGPEDAEREPAISVAEAGGQHGTASGGGRAAARRLLRTPRRTLVLLGALGSLAIFGAFVEDAGFSWGALFLRGEVGVGPAAAGAAFVALMVAMTVGRLTGDRVVDRFGQRRVARIGGVLIVFGMGGALGVPSLATAILGFALAGLGVATLIPAAMHAADELPGLPHGVGLTVVSWLLRVGFLVSPPAVGLVADTAGLRVALVGAVLAGVGVLVLGRVLLAAPARSAVDGEQPSLAAGPPQAAPVAIAPSSGRQPTEPR